MRTALRRVFRSSLPRFEKPADAFEAGYSAVGHDLSKASPFTSVQFSLPNRPGALIDFLKILADRGLNLTQISSRESQDNDSGEFITMFCDLRVEAENPQFKEALQAMRKLSPYAAVIATHIVPWYPRCIQDLNDFDLSTLAAGGDLNSDHPGFSDPEYRERRSAIAQIAQQTKIGDPIPQVEYTQAEHDTWGHVFDLLTSMYPTHACKEYNYVFPLMVENCGFSRNAIPQLENVNRFLMRRTGWRLRPVTGLLGPRDFLNGLGFRVFHSTQYIRHSSQPLYTPEPDICHELLGHVPMLADPHFAAFSHALGLASLGASDEDIKRLAALYWFTIEFGLVSDAVGQPKAYGAGVLSSPGELTWACGTDQSARDTIRGSGGGGLPEKPVYHPLVCETAASTDYVSRITKYQPEYFVAKSFPHMVEEMKSFAASLERPFRLAFNPYTSSVSTLSRNTERAMRGLVDTDDTIV